MTDLPAIARSLHTVIREGDAEADRLRRLPEAVATAMARAGLYRTAVASDVGGHEADPEETIRTIEAVSRASGAAGWNLMIAIEVSGLASGDMTDAAGRDTFGADPDSIVAGALNPLGRATPVEGGWRLSGRWPFASGCHNAGWWWGGAMIEGDDSGRPTQLLVPRSDYTIIDTWRVAGLRGSGSHDVEVRDAFVPEHRATAVTVRPSRRDRPLYRYPLPSRLSYNKVGVATGIARTAIDEFIDLAGAKTPYHSRELLRDRAQAQLGVADAEVTLAAGRAYLLEVVRTMWSDVTSGRQPTDDLRVRHRLAASHAVMSAVRAVETVHRLAGSTANFEASPLERLFRDVHVVQAHTTVSPAHFETAGRAFLGLPLAPGSY